MKTPSSIQSAKEQVDTVDRFTTDQMRKWVLELAEGRDVILESDDLDRTFYPVLALCRLAAPAVQQRICEAVVDVLVDSIKRDELSADLLENLLLLAQTLEVRESRDILEAFVGSLRFAAIGPDLQYRVLQTLIALNANLQPSFWYRILKGGSDKFAGIVFDGLALVSPNHAIDFLSRLTATDEIVKQISVGLPGFMDDIVPPSDRASVRSLIELRITEMQPAIANAVADFFLSEETPIEFLKLNLETQSEQPPSVIKITRDSFPTLAEVGETFDQVLGFHPYNPARLFRKLAHQ